MRYTIVAYRHGGGGNPAHAAGRFWTKRGAYREANALNAADDRRPGSLYYRVVPAYWVRDLL